MITGPTIVAELSVVMDEMTVSTPTVAASVNRLTLVLQQLFVPQHHFPSPQL